MEVTEVRVKLMDEPTSSNDRLLAFCSIVLDRDLVIRDLKVIEGAKGRFMAMPSRKLMDRCVRCYKKNHLRAKYCNFCGYRLNENRALCDADGRAKLHADIAHPINSHCREKIQAAVLDAYAGEVEAAKQPGYVCRYDDVDLMAPTAPLRRPPIRRPLVRDNACVHPIGVGAATEVPGMGGAA